MSESATYGSLHAGDIVLGQDGKEWGVEYIVRRWGVVTPGQASGLEVALLRYGYRVVGWPTEAQPVNVVRRADTALESGAYSALTQAGLAPEVIAERWTDVQE